MRAEGATVRADDQICLPGLGGSGPTGSGSTFTPCRKDVPPVLGMPLRRAVETMRAAGYKPAVTAARIVAEPELTVIAQGATGDLPKGTTVTLVISAGPHPHSDVIQLTRDKYGNIGQTNVPIEPDSSGSRSTDVPTDTGNEVP
ncbi:MAG TPA: PASTA domain-containing protein [Mycobacteriales bacterium]|nr:PASTA domain-containing protein [Mycobacteriales bacterium]